MLNVNKLGAQYKVDLHGIMIKIRDLREVRGVTEGDYALILPHNR